MLRAEIQIKMNNFKTMHEAVEFVNGLDRPVGMKQILLRNCFAMAVARNGKADFVYEVQGADFKDISVMMLPDNRYDRVEVAAWCGRINDNKVLGVYLEFDGYANEILFYLTRPLTPAEWIQLGVSIARYLNE